MRLAPWILPTRGALDNLPASQYSRKTFVLRGYDERATNQYPDGEGNAGNETPVREEGEPGTEQDAIGRSP